MSSSDPRDLLAELIRSFQTIMKKYDRGTRKKAKEALYRPRGRDMIDKIVDNPPRPIVGIPKLLDFREWLSVKAQRSDYNH